jgi:hypothetical protein
MHLFTPLQHQVISYIIAENEEIDKPNPLVPYMRALSGSLMPDMKFTLYWKEKTGLTLYVQDAGTHFRKHCGEIKTKLLEIAACMKYLVQQGYVRALKPWDNPQDPPDQWQGYTDFSPVEEELLVFACSIQLVPRLKLYDYWETRK